MTELTYKQELKLWLETMVKRQKAACGCLRVLDRQPGVDNWLIREWHPCSEHVNDHRIATIWI